MRISSSITPATIPPTTAGETRCDVGFPLLVPVFCGVTVVVVGTPGLKEVVVVLETRSQLKLLLSVKYVLLLSIVG